MTPFEVALVKCPLGTAVSDADLWSVLDAAEYDWRTFFANENAKYQNLPNAIVRPMVVFPWYGHLVITVAYFNCLLTELPAVGGTIEVGTKGQPLSEILMGRKSLQRAQTWAEAFDASEEGWIFIDGKAELVPLHDISGDTPYFSSEYEALASGGSN